MNRLFVALSLLALCAAESQDCQGGDCTAGGDSSVLLQNVASLKVASKEQDSSDDMSLEDALAQEQEEDAGEEEEAEQAMVSEEEEAGQAEEDERPSAMVSEDCQKCIDDIWTKSVAGMKDIMTVPAFNKCKAGCEQAAEATTTCRDSCRETAQANAKKMFNTACPVCSGGLALEQFAPDDDAQLDEEAAQVASFLEELSEEDTIDEDGNMITHDARLQMLQEEEEDREAQEPDSYPNHPDDEPDLALEAQEPDPYPTTPPDEPLALEQSEAEGRPDPYPSTPDDEA